MTEESFPSPSRSRTPMTLKILSQSRLVDFQSFATDLKKLSDSTNLDVFRIPPSDPSSRSDKLHASPVPANQNLRSFYLTNKSLVPAPLISCSEFVPQSLTELLMRNKKNSALGVKFVRSDGIRKLRLDKITNIEGAMHSFVTPVVGRCEMAGDYRYDMKHGVSQFGTANEQGHLKDKVLLTRTVVLSAAIQLDFEGSKVMLKASKLENTKVVGRDLGSEWSVMSTEEKQDTPTRNEYDEELKQHMVFYLTQKGILPPRSEVKDFMMVKDTIEFLNERIKDSGDIDQTFVGKYSELRKDTVVSLEFLFNAAVHQVCNEFSALEAVCPQGYVYTYDPASIFARDIGAPILNRLMLSALKHISDHDDFPRLRIYAFNDYADRGIMDLAAAALKRQSHVRVVRKVDLFKGPHGKYDLGNLEEGKGALLVIHNNSDGFGQNIETEWESGSLDGAIGSNSSGAASLERSRMDLLDFIC